MFFDHETKELAQDEDAGDDEPGGSEWMKGSRPPARSPAGPRARHPALPAATENGKRYSRQTMRSGIQIPLAPALPSPVR